MDAIKVSLGGRIARLCYLTTFALTGGPLLSSTTRCHVSEATAMLTDPLRKDVPQKHSVIRPQSHRLKGSFMIRATLSVVPGISPHRLRPLSARIGAILPLNR